MIEHWPPELEASLWLDTIALIGADLDRGGANFGAILDPIGDVEYLRALAACLASMYGTALAARHADGGEDPTRYLARYRQMILRDYLDNVDDSGVGA